MTHFVLIDGNNLLFASQAAAMDKGSRAQRLYSGEQETSAINGMLGKLRTIQLKFPDGKLIVLWDKGKNWRYDRYPEYKQNRKNNPQTQEIKEAMVSQRPYLTQLIEKMGVPQMEADGFEADDVAAFLSDFFAEKGNQVTLVTRDQDWLQLVRPSVSWYEHWKDSLISWLTFYADTGVETPAEFSEIKIVKGDAGDNVTGIKGVGDVAAAAIIDEFGTADDFLKEWASWVADGNPTVGHPIKRPIKHIERFMEDEEAAQEKINLNRELMDLRLMFAHAGLRARLSRAHKPLDKEGLKALLGQLSFARIAADLDAWIAPFHASNSSKH